jgi:hypothetical protein
MTSSFIVYKILPESKFFVLVLFNHVSSNYNLKILHRGDVVTVMYVDTRIALGSN